jgi:hypothetical protein
MEGGKAGEAQHVRSAPAGGMDRRILIFKLLDDYLFDRGMAVPGIGLIEAGDL